MDDLIPIGDRLIVEPIDDQPAQTAGGIIIPDQARKKPHKGTVVALSEELTAYPGTASSAINTTAAMVPVLAIGDVVFYGEFAGSAIPGSAQIVMNLSDVIAKLKRA